MTGKSVFYMKLRNNSDTLEAGHSAWPYSGEYSAMYFQDLKGTTTNPWQITDPAPLQNWDKVNES